MQDPSKNILPSYQEELKPFFNPKSVAVVGATDRANSVGSTIMTNLIEGGFEGDIIPINHKKKEVHGFQCFASLSDYKKRIDLVIIVIPAQHVPKIVRECIKNEIPCGIIISAGFKEMGPPGIALENEVLEIANEGNFHIIGPNCLGVMAPHSKLNATFAADMALPGSVAFISQSGAFCTSVLDWSLERNIGFSAFISIGSMIDVNWGHLIEYLGQDEKTESILIYMETVGDAEDFLSAARKIALSKPIIVIKAGRTEAAAQAAASHTGSIAGSDETFDAALSRVGVLRVNTIDQLFSMANVLNKQPKPLGPNLTIITNAGGPAVIATDNLISSGGELTPLAPETISRLNEFLPAAWSHNNPVDILGDATADIYEKTIEVLKKDPNTDAILVILTPQDMTDPEATAQSLAQASKNYNKPLLTSWMGGKAIRKGAEILTHANIPCFSYPDMATEIFSFMWQYTKNLEALYETPEDRSDILEMEIDAARKKSVRAIISQAHKENRTILTEYESKKILLHYEIPTVQTMIAKTKQEAIEMAQSLAFPLVVKLLSSTITHKSDVGGVILNLQTPEEVGKAFEEIEQKVCSSFDKKDFEGVTIQQMVTISGYEIILGSHIDPQFGPIVLFGTGGKLVEIYKDASTTLIPLNTSQALQLIKKTKIYEALLGTRGEKPVNLPLLQSILVNFSQLLIDHPEIKECDINPFLASSDQVIALDARMILKEKNEDIKGVVIAPYPLHQVVNITLKENETALLRPIKPDDETLMIKFHNSLSKDTVRSHYFKDLSIDERVRHSRLIQTCWLDYNKEITLVAEHNKQIIGLISIIPMGRSKIGNLSLVISDAFHHRGLGTQMIKHALLFAKELHFEAINATVLDENSQLIYILTKQNFTLSLTERSLHTYAKKLS